MQWGTYIRFVTDYKVREGIFVGYERHGGREYPEVSLVVEKDKDRVIFVNTENIISPQEKEVEQ